MVPIAATMPKSVSQSDQEVTQKCLSEPKAIQKLLGDHLSLGVDPESHF